MRRRESLIEVLSSEVIRKTGLVPGGYSWGGWSGRRSCPVIRVQYTKVVCPCTLGVVKAGQSWCVNSSETSFNNCSGSWCVAPAVDKSK